MIEFGGCGTGITIWKELMSFDCFISARQLNLMQPWRLIYFSTLKLSSHSEKFVSRLGIGFTEKNWEMCVD